MRIDPAAVSLREITAETVLAVVRLEVAEAQKGFVAANAISLAQALFAPEAWYRAICLGDTPVGFVMLEDQSQAVPPPEHPEISLWRFMIDARHQGQGIGRAALRLVIDQVRGRERFARLATSYVPGPGCPEPFYRGLAFRPTGRLDGKEVVLELPLRPMRTLETAGLVLEPLTVAHAEAMFEILRDPELYRYLDDQPPASVEPLRERYARLERRASADGRQRWLNWVVREAGQPPLGYVQATVLDDGSAWVAYLLGSGHQGRGVATRATAAMLDHLASDYGVERQLAIVEAENLRSIRLLERLGFRAMSAEEAVGHEPTATERLFVRP